MGEHVWVAIEHNSGGAGVVGVFADWTAAEEYVDKVVAASLKAEADFPHVTDAWLLKVYGPDHRNRPHLATKEAYVKAEIAKSEMTQTHDSATKKVWSRKDGGLNVTLQYMPVLTGEASE